MSIFECPQCRHPLAAPACATCGGAYVGDDGIPDLLGADAFAERCRGIGAYYDALYRSRTDVWREQGHTDAFTRYVAGLVEAAGAGRYLDVGCGEGFFLEAARGMDGYGVDLSREALARARRRSGATVALGSAERLPFAAGAFDVVTSIGAMEHFLDAPSATREVRRVLKRRGRYLLALLTEVTSAERCAIKFREFVWPRPRPVRAARWLQRRLLAPARGESATAYPQQPIQNRYHPASARALFEQNGFRVVRQIRHATDPEAPLPGHYMRFYCLEAV